LHTFLADFRQHLEPPRATPDALSFLCMTSMVLEFLSLRSPAISFSFDLCYWTRDQRGLGARRIVLDPVDRLPAQSRGPGNLRNTHGLLRQHITHGVDLLAGEARLAAKVGAVIIQLGVLNTGPPGSLGGFRPP